MGTTDDDLASQEEAAVKEFSSIPWTKAYLDKPNISFYTPSNRTRKDSNEDALFGSTLNTEQTIGNCITFYDKPAADATGIPEVHTLMSIGSGLDGWPKVMHGGIVATLIDEAMGVLIFTQIAFHRANPGRNDGPDRNMAVVGGGCFTATLNISYKDKVRTPGPVLVTAKYLKTEGRKQWLYAELRQFNKETGKEVVCTTAEALFIAVKANL